MSAGAVVQGTCLPSSIPPLRQRMHADPCTMIIMGATGDLTRRKLMPAIYDLAAKELLPKDFRLVGVGREASLDDVSFRALMRSALEQAEEMDTFEPAAWAWLESRMFYADGDFTDPATYAGVREKLEALQAAAPLQEENRLFYLAVPPSIFEPCVKHLAESKLAPRVSHAGKRPWVRVVIEKPFGRDLASAKRLNRFVLDRFKEHQVYRIDHYLGKESVQNILVLRFANAIFEPLWNRHFISHVKITASESVGIDQRGAYYEEAGVVRDMFQNHLLQLVTLTAMEPPSSLSAEAVRDEKVKVLRALRPIMYDGIPSAIQAQYESGEVDGAQVPGYHQERNVAAQSRTPTYAALKLNIDNWRWQGVPFYLRSGKRLAERSSRIDVVFNMPPHLMFGETAADTMLPALLTMRVQPDEGISLRFQVKTPGAVYQLEPGLQMSPVRMDFAYQTAFGDDTPPAYETLLLDIMLGDATLFTRSDEVETAWSVIDPLLQYWHKHPDLPIATYPAGSTGPVEADNLLIRDGVAWE